jgi:hypothetical protein
VGSRRASRKERCPVLCELPDHTQTQLTGLTSKYEGSLGLVRSMMTSSYDNPSSLTTMCARCAYGQPWLVYRVILGAFPLTAAMVATQMCGGNGSTG